VHEISQPRLRNAFHGLFDGEGLPAVFFGVGPESVEALAQFGMDAQQGAHDGDGLSARGDGVSDTAAVVCQREIGAVQGGVETDGSQLPTLARVRASARKHEGQGIHGRADLLLFAVEFFEVGRS